MPPPEANKPKPDIGHRSFEIRADSVDAEQRTVELAFSSTEPYTRWWGVEILDHKAESVRMGRVSNRAPLLLDHNMGKQIGVIESARIDSDGVGRAVVRFSKSALGEEILQDVRDGIRSKVSVGYQIHAYQLESKNGDEETYRITDWEPFEISIVSVPADDTVGVGRSADEFAPKPPAAEQRETDETAEASPAPADTQPEQEARHMTTVTADDAVKAERDRVREINAIGARIGQTELARQFVESGESVEAFRAAVLERMAGSKPVQAESAELGLSDKEARAFSFIRALNALANPNDKRAQDAAAYEREVSSAAAAKRGKDSAGIFVPTDVLRLHLGGQQRDLTVGTATAGGHTVATDLLAGSFIDLLRSKLVIMGMGATMLNDLNGNVAIPRQTGGATAYWVAESGAPTESQQAFDQVALTPKTLGAFTDISRRLLLQSSIDVEAFVKRDIATVIALAIQLAAINGSGASNQPRGILNTSGIGSVVGGTDGLAPTWNHLVDLESALSTVDADVGTLGYLTNAKVRGKLKKTQMFSGTNGIPVWDRDNTLNGYRAEVTNAVPSNLVKGSSGAVCSAIIFGNFADLILGFWSGLDLTVDPYTNSTSGTVRVVALQDCDVAVRHPESFAAMVDALTT